MMCFSQIAKSDVKLNLESNIPTYDTININTAPVGSMSFYDAAIKVQTSENSKLYLTIGYLQISKLAALTATTTYLLTSSNPYFGFDYYFSKGFLSLGVYYSAYVQGNYSQSGSGSEVWSGSAGYIKTSFHKKVGESFNLNLSLAYYAASYTAKTATPAISSATNFNQSVFSPLIGFDYTF